LGRRIIIILIPPEGAAKPPGSIMTDIVLPALLLLIASGVGFRLWLRRLREQRIAKRRRVEAPNSQYSSLLVRQLEDRARWGRIVGERLHPLNRHEVERLLQIADADGVGVLSSRERLFLDNMTIPRLSL
jgi:transposase